MLNEIVYLCLRVFRCPRVFRLPRVFRWPRIFRCPRTFPPLWVVLPMRVFRFSLTFRRLRVRRPPPSRFRLSLFPDNNSASNFVREGARCAPSCLKRSRTIFAASLLVALLSLATGVSSPQSASPKGLSPSSLKTMHVRSRTTSVPSLACCPTLSR